MVLNNHHKSVVGAFAVAFCCLLLAILSQHRHYQLLPRFLKEVNELSFVPFNGVFEENLPFDRNIVNSYKSMDERNTLLLLHLLIIANIDFNVILAVHYLVWLYHISSNQGMFGWGCFGRIGDEVR